MTPVLCVAGSPADPGVLPRALELVFRHVAGRQYEHADLKPFLSSDVQKLDSEQVKVEMNGKAALFSLLREVRAAEPLMVASQNAPKTCL